MAARIQIKSRSRKSGRKVSGEEALIGLNLIKTEKNDNRFIEETISAPEIYHILIHP